MLGHAFSVRLFVFIFETRHCYSLHFGHWFSFQTHIVTPHYIVGKQILK